MKWTLAPTLLLLASAAQAHAGERHGLGWTLDLSVTGPLAIAAMLYAIGFLRLAPRSDLGRAQLRRNALLFACGWLLLAGAIVSPLHEAGERSFALHMVEHEAIMLPASLLLVLSRPGAILLWGLPGAVRKSIGGAVRSSAIERFWRAIANPVTATALQALALILWHMPALFDRALEREGWHVAQHLCFFLTALLFWWTMVHSRIGRRGYGLSAACLFVTSLIGGLLGALMSLSASPWYAAYAAMGMSPIGLSAIEDQQLAGIIMWIPGGLFHGGAALYFVHKWLNFGEGRDALPAA